jgi:inorganic phosphate transporter, PiT family
MLFLTLLLLATLFLAYSNGANDNFKGVATLLGSGTTNYKKAIWWATVTTFIGSVCSIFLAETLVKNFSGKGLVPDAIIASPYFLLAVALGAGLTVILATLTGFPISTTHSLTGALIGSGLVAAGSQVNFVKLGGSFFAPLLLSPVIAVALSIVVYTIAHAIRLRSGATKEWCICVGGAETCVLVTEPRSFFASSAMTLPSIAIATKENCKQRYAGKMTGIGLPLQKLLDAAHFFSAGSVSFARGLNDTPKLVALLLIVHALSIRWGMLAVAVGMAVGGLLNARKVAIMMSKKITPMTPSQGFTGNIVTAGMVIFASRLGMPVSTTHVSCGSLFGIGLITRQANVRVISQILMSWVLTLPVAAILSATTYWLLTVL